MAFSFGGSGFGPSPTVSGLQFGGGGMPGTMQSSVSVESVEKGAGTIASIAGSVRSIWDSVKGNTPTGQGTYTYEGDPNVEPSNTDRAKQSINSVFSNILDTLKTTGQAAVRGALEGAQTTSAGARSGAQAGAQVAGMSTTVLLGGALLLVLVLRK